MNKQLYNPSISMWCCCTEEEEGAARIIAIPNSTDSSNKIQTTKYNLLTFLPKSIFLQFLRAANYVYLLSAILNFLPIISSSSPAVSLAPFVVILIVSVLREGYEDYKRHKNDKIINESTTQILLNDVFIGVKWEQVKVGNYVKVTNKESIPADLILLYSTEENGIAYVQTANLDGQRNLKSKYCIENVPNVYPEQYSTLRASVEVEAPNQNLHDFSGKIQFKGTQPVAMGKENILLRGTVLKNTHFIIGLVVYTGHETKIMLNQGNFKHKSSFVQRRVNVIQIILGIILLAMCIMAGIMHYNTVPVSSIFYLSRASPISDPLQAAATAMASFLLLNFIVPISMNISIQVLKTFQADFYGLDDQMTCLINSEKQPCKVLNSLIIQELGNVSYILTDKTGTLTSNTMEFKQLWVNCQQYTTEDLMANPSHLKQVVFFWACATICHDAIIDTQNSQFQGSSADEVCFLECGNLIGYRFIKRTKTHIEIDIRGQKIVFELLIMLRFTHRKMMSVIVRDLQTREIIMITKGADSSILPRRDPSYPQNQLDSLNQFLLKVSKQGLRTLVFSQRSIPQDQFQQFMLKHREFLQRTKSKKLSKDAEDKLQFKLFDSIEHDLNIIGATAIQDKLQEAVPESIARFREAGIKVVMITGDKLQTAQNIGHLSNFINIQAEVFRLREDIPRVEQWIEEVAQLVPTISKQFSFIIEGQAISQVILNDSKSLVKNVRQIVERCNSVIFCRSTPAEKALIVQFFKKTFSSTILAIGDGGNDVNMIKQADIGIGLIGKEGNEAAYASDFYFGQFKHLERLLFHHGRWSYNRISYFFVYFGFKNNMITLLLFFYLFYCGYSAQYGLSQLYQGCYNSFLGIIPTMYLGIFEQDVNADQHPNVKPLLPKLYKQCRSTDLFSYRRYFYWVAFSIVCSVWIFFTTLYILDSTVSIDSRGSSADWISFSTNLQLTSCLIVMGVLAIDLQIYNWWTVFCIGGGAYFASFVVFIIENYSQIDTFDDCFNGFTDNFNLRFWLLAIVLTSAVLVPKLVYKAFEYEYFPDLVKRIRKMQKKTQVNATESLTQLKLQSVPQ